MSSMDKMWASFIAMGLMALASWLVIFARAKTKGIIRFILTFIAFILFFPIMLYMLVSMM